MTLGRHWILGTLLVVSLLFAHPGWTQYAGMPEEVCEQIPEMEQQIAMMRQQGMPVPSYLNDSLEKMKRTCGVGLRAPSARTNTGKTTEPKPPAPGDGVQYRIVFDEIHEMHRFEDLGDGITSKSDFSKTRHGEAIIRISKNGITLVGPGSINYGPESYSVYVTHPLGNCMLASDLGSERTRAKATGFVQEDNSLNIMIDDEDTPPRQASRERVQCSNPQAEALLTPSPSERTFSADSFILPLRNGGEDVHDFSQQLPGGSVKHIIRARLQRI